MSAAFFTPEIKTFGYSSFLKYVKTIILEYTPRGGGAPFEKFELAFRNELTQTWD